MENVYGYTCEICEAIWVEKVQQVVQNESHRAG